MIYQPKALDMREPKTLVVMIFYTINSPKLRFTKQVLSTITPNLEMREFSKIETSRNARQPELYIKPNLGVLKLEVIFEVNLTPHSPFSSDLAQRARGTLLSSDA